MYQAYRDDVNRVYTNALGTGSHNFVTRGVTRGFAETFGLVYAGIEAATGHPQDKLDAELYRRTLKPIKSFDQVSFGEQKSDRQYRIRRNRVSDNRAQLDNSRSKESDYKSSQAMPKGEKKMKKRSQTRKGGAKKKASQKGKAKKPTKKASRGGKKSYQKSGPPVSFARRRFASPRLPPGYQAPIRGKMFAGSIWINYPVWDATLEWGHQYSTSTDLKTVITTQTRLWNGFIPNFGGPPPMVTMADGSTNSWAVGDNIIPVNPLLGRYWSNILFNEVLTKRRFYFNRLSLEYAPQVPTSDKSNLAFAYTADPTTLDLGHINTPQNIWNDNVIKNMTPCLTGQSYAPMVLDATRYLPKRPFYLRNQHTYPNTPASWPLTTTSGTLISTWSGTSVPSTTNSLISAPTSVYDMLDSLQFSGSWSQSDVRQSVQGAFIVQVTADQAVEGAQKLGDVYFHYDLRVMDRNHQIGSNLGQEYQYVGPPSTGLTAPTTSALTTTAAPTLTTRLAALEKLIEEKLSVLSPILEEKTEVKTE